MHVHPPDHPIMSIRQFLLHIFIITIGLLIALALEGLVARFHERGVVREARENLRAELLEIRGKVDENVKDQKQTIDLIKRLLEYQIALRKDRHVPDKDIDTVRSFVVLPTTSWDTAKATGAVGLMTYPEVRRYTAAYDGARIYGDSEDDAKRTWYELSGLLADPQELTDSQLADGEKLLRISLTQSISLKEIGEMELERIDNALKSAP